MTRDPAGGWRRLAAFGLDYLVIAAYMVVLTIVSVTGTSQLTEAPVATEVSPWMFDLLAFVTLVLPVILYFALSEASQSQATWGKRRVGIVVVTTHGERLSPSRSIVRSALKFLPWQIAHTCLFHIPGWPTAVEAIPVAASAGLWVASLLACASIATLFIAADHRTLYDRLARTGVIRLPTR